MHMWGKCQGYVHVHGNLDDLYYSYETICGGGRWRGWSLGQKLRASAPIRKSHAFEHERSVMNAEICVLRDRYPSGIENFDRRLVLHATESLRCGLFLLEWTIFHTYMQ